MTNLTQTVLSRRGLLGAFAATAVVAAPTYSNAFGLLRGAGDVRRVRMYSGRTGESLDTIYWIEGKYIKEVLKEINYFMRDWRNDQTETMDPRTVDIMAASHRLLDVSEPYMLLSGYRSPQTNAMLRSKSRGVAKHSLHMVGQAAEIAVGGPDGPRGRGLRLGRGWPVFGIEFRAYGLRPGAPLGRLSRTDLQKQKGRHFWRPFVLAGL